MTPLHLLRGSALLVLLTGAGLLVWFLDRMLLHPWARLRHELPFWIPFLVTVVGGLVALAFLFLRAAKRYAANRGD